MAAAVVAVVAVVACECSVVFGPVHTILHWKIY